MWVCHLLFECHRRPTWLKNLLGETETLIPYLPRHEVRTRTTPHAHVAMAHILPPGSEATRAVNMC
eukprot:1410217-Prymnesium_polylepis.1